MVVRERGGAPRTTEGERPPISPTSAPQPSTVRSAAMRRVVDRDSAGSHAVTADSVGRKALRRLRRGLDADPLLLAVVGIAGGLRIWSLGTQSIWYDEFV